MHLEVFEFASGETRIISDQADQGMVAETVRGLPWDDITFVTLTIDEKNLMEGSGSLNPEDGLSARYVENGAEHISRYGPESLEVIIGLLGSYLAGDDRWRSLIAWD